MAKLILSLDGQIIKEYDISKERMTVGRKPHNDIQIDNLAVSGEHAMIMTILNDSFLEDLGSTNGTMVNGQPVKKHFLQSDDVVEIGKYKLKYVNDKAGKVSQQEFEKTMVLKAPTGGAATAQTKSATNTQTNTQTNSQVNKQGEVRTNPEAAAQARAKLAASSGQTTTGTPASSDQTTTGNIAGAGTNQTTPGNMAAGGAGQSTTGNLAAANTGQAAAGGKNQADVTTSPVPPGVDTSAAIQILSGPNAGRELSLSKPLTTLGKPGIQVAVIAKRPQGYFITHVEGANFPVVNGKPLDAQAQKLQDHDIIELANVKMEFFLKG